MTEKIIYVAIDGKEFEIERDCVDYENSLRMNRLCKSTLFLNEHFEIMNFQTFDPEQIFYIYVNNDDDKNFINEYFNNEWCSSPFSTDYGQYADLSECSGWFYFNTEKEQWQHFETDKKIFENMENNFTKIMLDKGLKI